jgi:hypothetical protein
VKTFISYSETLKDLLPIIMNSAELHSRWLNTLSYLENSGARKIAACEHPTLVKEEMLKHASEEFRHAHYLKSQIGRISPHILEDYSRNHLLGGRASLNYLSYLDLQACRYLKKVGLKKTEVRECAYLLVTYAIELRADELYRIYDDILRQYRSKVTVKSILLEEKEHLNEMREGIGKLASGWVHVEKVCTMESMLCKNWLAAVSAEIF